MKLSKGAFIAKLSTTTPIEETSKDQNFNSMNVKLAYEVNT